MRSSFVEESVRQATGEGPVVPCQSAQRSSTLGGRIVRQAGQVSAGEIGLTHQKGQDLSRSHQRSERKFHTSNRENGRMKVGQVFRVVEPSCRVRRRDLSRPQGTWFRVI